MPSSALGSVADNLLQAILQNALGSARDGVNPFAAFLPPQVNDPRGRLSAGDLVDLLGGVRSSLLDLSTAATALDLANPTSSFFAAAVSSSDAAAIKAETVPGVSIATQPTTASYTYTVSQVAVAQQNVGTTLTSTATSSFKTGTNTFSVTQNGTTTNVSFTVGASDSNLTVLTNMAAAINAITALGVTATVTTDTVANTSHLTIQSDLTGAANAFTLSNVSKTPITDAGVSSVTIAAADASYTQNGVALTSSTNDLYLIGTNSNLHVTLLAATSSPVTVAVGPDTSQIGAAIGSLVAAFNGAKGFFEGHADLYPGVVTQLNQIASRLRGQLTNVGIRVAADRTLSVDSATLTSALGSYLGSMQQAVGDVGGLAKELRALGDTLLAQPLSLAPPLPPFSPGVADVQLIGLFAKRIGALRLSGLLVDALA